MVEMHLLSVNSDFQYDPIYALGVVTSFDRFMEGYRPDQDKASILRGLCQAVEDNDDHYRHDAEQIRAAASGLSIETWKQQFPNSENGATGLLADQFRAIANNPNFKYSRLFAIGLYTLLEQVDPEAINDEKQRHEILKQTCEALHLPEEKVQKDLDLYRSNLEKMTQAQAVIADILEADRKKREERAQKIAAEKTASASTSESVQEQESSGTN